MQPSIKWAIFLWAAFGTTEQLAEKVSQAAMKKKGPWLKPR
jgi:hypothetical protein